MSWVHDIESNCNFPASQDAFNRFPNDQPRPEVMQRRQKAGPIATWQQSRAEGSNTQGYFGAE